MVEPLPDGGFNAANSPGDGDDSPPPGLAYPLVRVQERLTLWLEQSYHEVEGFQGEESDAAIERYLLLCVGGRAAAAGRQIPKPRKTRLPAPR